MKGKSREYVSDVDRGVKYHKLATINYNFFEKMNSIKSL